jgi:hypothetical protein
MDACPALPSKRDRTSAIHTTPPTFSTWEEGH